MSVPRRVTGPEEPVGKAETVLAAAERAFLAGGFGAVTMDAVAREAGVSKATVYAHFHSKEELFGAVIAHVSERRFHGFSVDTLDPCDIEGSLTTIAARFLDLILSPEAIAVNRIIIGEVTRFPALGQVFWAAGPERTRAQIEAFLRRAATAGSLALSDARLAAEQFAALARGELHYRSLSRQERPADPAALAAAATNAVATFLRAFRPGTREPGREFIKAPDSQRVVERLRWVGLRAFPFCRGSVLVLENGRYRLKPPHQTLRLFQRCRW